MTIDATAPVRPTIASFSTDSGTVGDHLTNDRTPTLTGTAEANSTIKVYDGATLLGSTTTTGTGAWSYTTTALNDGVHNFTSTATDAAGNTSSASTALSLTIDTSAPTLPVITSQVAFRGLVFLNGTAEANSTVSIFDSASGALVGTALATGDGAWTLLRFGSFATDFTLTAVDVAGNVISTGDSTPPAAPSIASFSTDSGAVGDHITNDNTLTLTGAAEANSTVKVFDGATLLGSATANGTGAWSFTTAALANGAHNLTATATDTAGNTGVASAALSVTIDTTAPVAPSITSNAIVNLNDVALTGTAEANATIKIFDGATLLGSAIASGTGAWSFTTAALANGTHNLTATATDVAGNIGSASTAVPVTINVPVATTPTIVSFSVDSGTVGDGITNDKILTLTGTADANTTIKVFDGATLLGTSTADSGGAWSFLTPALADGLHDFAATAGLANGGHSLATSPISSTLAVTIDATAPVSPTITSFSTDSGTVGDHVTNDNTPTLTGTAEANSTIKVYDGAALLGSTTTNGAGAWSYTSTALTDGIHHFSSTATDAAGNTGTASTALDLTIDTLAPTAPSITSDAIVNGNHLAVNGLAEAHSLVKIYDGATLLGSANSDAGGSWNFVTGALNNGSHSLTATDTDLAGNTSTVSSAVNATVDAPISVSANNFTAFMRGLANISGTSEANSSVSVSDGNTGALLGHTTAGSNGAWSALMGNMPYNTIQNFVLTATDTAGHLGSTQAVFGTAGDDVIANTAANQVMFGNGGADTFVFGGNVGKAVVADFQADNDVLQLSHNAFANFADVLAHAAQVGPDVTIAIDASNSVTLHNTAVTQLGANNIHLV